MQNRYSIEDISPVVAQKAIGTLMNGEPPTPKVLELISVGIEKDIKVFNQEYFRQGTFITSDSSLGSTFKIVQAYYGGGKTHYLRAVESAAHKHNFVSAFVQLRKDECPLTHFDLIYTAVTEVLNFPTNDETNHNDRGLSSLIKHWVNEHLKSNDSEDVIATIQEKLDSISDLPLMSMKTALRIAVDAYLTNDDEQFEEVMIYLNSGKISPHIRKMGILESINNKNGSRALRSLSKLIRKLGYAGFIFILDEGDRSLSIASNKEKRAASNNLVQLINEMASDGSWSSTVLLYSIPSWEDFQEAFSHNQALIQRVRPTGYPNIPPATRIVLDDRRRSEQEKEDFCINIGKKLYKLFRAAYPEKKLSEEASEKNAKIITKKVLYYETGSSFCRLFVQSYLSALYFISNNEENEEISEGDADQIVQNATYQLKYNG